MLNYYSNDAAAADIDDGTYHIMAFGVELGADKLTSLASSLPTNARLLLATVPYDSRMQSSYDSARYKLLHQKACWHC